MAILKWFVPRKIRRVAHPVGYARRRLTPKPVRAVGSARHPVGTATSATIVAGLHPRAKKGASREGAAP